MSSKGLVVRSISTVEMGQRRRERHAGAFAIVDLVDPRICLFVQKLSFNTVDITIYPSLPIPKFSKENRKSCTTRLNPIFIYFERIPLDWNIAN